MFLVGGFGCLELCLYGIRNPMISTNQSTVYLDGSRPMRELHSAIRRGDTAAMFALKEGKTELVKILANCPQVDLDVVDEDLKHLEEIAG